MSCSTGLGKSPCEHRGQCGAAEELGWHQEESSRMLKQLPRMTNVRVDIHVSCSDQDLNEWLQSYHGSLWNDAVESLATIPLLARQSVEAQQGRDKRLAGPGGTVSWSKARGWQRPRRSSAAS